MSGIKLAQAPAAYDRANESQVRQALEKADSRNLKRGEDVRLEQGERLIIKSEPGGTRYSIYVDEADGLVKAEIVS